MRNMTDNVVVSWDKTEKCPHCGATLPARLYYHDGNMDLEPWLLGYQPCTCEAAEAERQAAKEAQEAEEIQRQAQARRDAAKRAGIPARYRDADHPYAEKMAEMAARGHGFYIYGPNGTFKTTCAMAAGIRLVNMGKSILSVGVYEIMDAMRSRKDEDRAIFSRACSVDVLILDDMGKEASNTPYACERLFAIIDKRDKEMLPVIVTSNYKLSEIAKKITEGAVGVAIASRLSGSCEQVPMEGEDRRLHG